MKIVIIADVSGSVNHRELNNILLPVVESLDEEDNDVWVVFADTQVRAVFRAHKVRENWDQIKLVGHGGTDMAGVRREVMATMKPDYVIVMSDGMHP